MHDGKKKFICDICNASFGRKSHLDQHVHDVHDKRKPFQCDICNAKFGQKVAQFEYTHMLQQSMKGGRHSNAPFVMLNLLQNMP